MLKRFRHSAKVTTANIGDFERPVTPHIMRAVKDVLTRTTTKPLVIEEVESSIDWDAVLDNAYKRYAAKIAETRKNTPKAERAAAVAALKWERGLTVQAIKERRANERHAIRLERIRKRPPPEPPSQG